MWFVELPTRSLGMRRNSDPCFKKTSPAVCAGLIPTPSSVMMALVSGVDLNCSAANLTTAVKGTVSGTDIILNGNLGSDVSVILNVTFVALGFGMLHIVAAGCWLLSAIMISPGVFVCYSTDCENS